MFIFSKNFETKFICHLVNKNNKNMIITNIKINIYLYKELFYSYQTGYTYKGKLQGRNPKPKLIFTNKNI